MTGPLVSCVIPVFNGEAYLREAIDSVLAQTWGTVEVLVVDDGSTDGTAAVARSYGHPVRYLHQENAGPAAARNRGIEAARGALVAFLDADDLWAPERIARQVVALEADPRVSYTLCLIQNFWIPELEAEADARRLRREGAPAPGYLAGGVLARREAFEQVGGFDPQLGHGDSADWFLRARRAGLEEVMVPEVLVFRRIHGDNRSRVHADASREEFLHLIKRQLDQRRAGPPPGQVP
jgi:glycosyltransferase involved in cell wall biosynthesis